MEPKAFPMNGGDGAYSYAKNSQYQRAASDSAKEMIKEAITDKMDLGSLSLSSNTIRITDLGCSVGPNTFITMQSILEVMEMKFHSHDYLPRKTPEFQLFFNDHTSNDFNTLFASLPPNRRYFAAGVPGSFHGRLFPESSLHIVYSSYALQWLSEVPQEVLAKSSPAWNRGRVHYTTSASEEVTKAYAAQFGKDMGLFLSSRADEVVIGGLMMLIMPALPDGAHCSRSPTGVLCDLLEQGLADMVKEGSIKEAEVDTFNLPIYAPCPKEMKQLIEANGCFSIERIELTNPRSKIDGPIDVQALVKHLRAGFEGMLTQHFGTEIIDELFERIVKRSAENLSQLESSYSIGTQLFLVLKRK